MNIKWYAGEYERIEERARKALEMTGEAIRTDLIQQQTVPFAEDPHKVAARRLTASGMERGKAFNAKVREMANASGVVPGQLQGSIFVDRTESSSGKVAVVSNTPYARRLYFHPEYRFFRGTNKRAGGEWYKPYLTDRRDWVEKAFARLMRRA